MVTHLWQYLRYWWNEVNFSFTRITSDSLYLHCSVGYSGTWYSRRCSYFWYKLSIPLPVSTQGHHDNNQGCRYLEIMKLISDQCGNIHTHGRTRTHTHACALLRIHMHAKLHTQAFRHKCITNGRRTDRSNKGLTDQRTVWSSDWQTNWPTDLTPDRQTEFVYDEQLFTYLETNFWNEFTTFRSLC